jgi:hypothetical protein
VTRELWESFELGFLVASVTDHISSGTIVSDGRYYSALVSSRFGSKLKTKDLTIER